MEINATVWNRVSQGIFDKHQALLWLIAVENMNTIVSEISQQTHHMKGKYYHNYSNVAWCQILFYMYQQHMVPD